MYFITEIWIRLYGHLGNKSFGAKNNNMNNQGSAQNQLTSVGFLGLALIKKTEINAFV